MTDTTAAPDAPYIDDIREVDVLIDECYFSDGAEELAAMTGHSCLTPVLQVAAEARVGRLVLVHINPIADGQDAVDLAAARRRFPTRRSALTAWKSCSDYCTHLAPRDGNRT